MSNLVQTSAIESALVNNDLSKLNPDQRLMFYKSVCDSLGLNSLTQPLAYINLNGKLTLYAKKDATDQLRRIYRVSIKITDKQKLDDIYMVTVSATTADGRLDEATGAVNVAGLKGEALANAILKCESKAKRRVTLSICGLGLLDETEIQDIDNSQKAAPFNNDPFGKKAAEIASPTLPDEEIPEDVVIEDKPEEHDLGNYEIKFGKKHAGKRLKDMDVFELDNYIQWLKNQSNEKGVELTGSAAELAEIGEAYLKSLEFEMKR